MLGAQGFQVRIHDLTIDAVKPPDLELLCQSNERRLAGIGGLRKHGLSKKHSANGDAIKTTHQFALVIPSFCAVAKAQFMKLDIGFNEVV